METEPSAFLFYKRSNFVTQLPLAYRYTSSHCWAAEVGDRLWRVGFTKFATRMLGEMVDHSFSVSVGALVSPGDVLGSVEGFKALTELYCIAMGEFAGGNPTLVDDVGVISNDPYQSGWIYLLKGDVGANCVDAKGYRSILDATIERILEAQKEDETPNIQLL